MNILIKVFFLLRAAYCFGLEECLFWTPPNSLLENNQVFSWQECIFARPSDTSIYYEYEFSVYSRGGVGFSPNPKTRSRTAIFWSPQSPKPAKLGPKLPPPTFLSYFSFEKALKFENIEQGGLIVLLLNVGHTVGITLPLWLDSWARRLSSDLMYPD